MDRELTFHPETEQTRDLIYSEYSSCDRSIHLLFQEGPGVPYELLLQVYRMTVAAYLSFENLRTPVDFLEELLSRYDDLSSESAVPVDKWKTAGIHLVLRSVDAVYVLTSRDSEVLLCSEGRMASLGESIAGGVERLHIDRGKVQQELFPTTLGGILSIVKHHGPRTRGMTFVLGCGEEERQTVLDALAGPVRADSSDPDDGRAVRQSLVSPFVKHRILAVRFESSVPTSGRVHEERPARRKRIRAVRFSRRWWVMGAGALVVAALIGVLWRSESGSPARRGSTAAPKMGSAPPAGGVQEAWESNSNRLPAVRPSEIRLSEAWRKKYTGEVTSSPILFEGCVVFGCRDGSLNALERTAGTTLWSFSASAGIGASPEIRGGRVFVADYNGNVYAVDGRTGKDIWARRVPARVVSSPEAVDDRIVVGCFDGYAYAFSAADGSTLWKQRTRGRIRGSPASASGVVFMPSYDGYLYALSAADGAVTWRTNLGGPVASSPAVEQGLVVAGAADGKVHGLDSATGARRWSYSTGAAVKSSVAIADGKVYVGSNDRFLYCLNVADGAYVWKFRTGDVILARPLVHDGIVYAACYDGRLYALEAVGGRLLSSFEAGGEVFSSPAGDDDSVYFGTNNGDFICLHVRSETLP